MVLGKHSGRHAFKNRLEELGFRMDEEKLQSVFEQFEALADVKKVVFDDDLIAIVEQQTRAGEVDRYKLKDLRIEIATEGPRATVTLECNGEPMKDSGTGDGGLDAAFSTIKKMVGLEESVLMSYKCSSVTQGTDALGQATIALRHNGNEVVGRGTDTDVLRASVKAFVDAVNRLILTQPRERIEEGIV